MPLATTAVAKSPLTYGLPAKFESWRQYQPDALKHTLKSFERGVDYVGLMIPTGVGKSSVAIALARHFLRHYTRPDGSDDGSPLKVRILVSTNFLLNQYHKDFPGMLAPVKGMGNYPCQALLKREFPQDVQRAFWTSPSHTPMCDQAPCLVGVECARKQFEGVKPCDYWEAVRGAQAGEISLTNYAYQLTGPLGNVDLMIWDEAHEVMKALDSNARIEHAGMPGDLESAKHWAQKKLDNLAGEKSIEKVREREVMHRLLEIADPENWVFVPGTPRTKPAWAPIKLRYEASRLANSARHVVAMSATLRESDVREFMEASARKFTWNYKQFPSPFPVSRRPMVHVSTEPPMKVRFDMPIIERHRLFAMADEIVEDQAVNLGRRGTFHSVSYDWAKEYFAYTRHKSLVVFPRNAKEIVDAVDRYKARKGGALLISPSITTGVDLPYDFCRFQIILKVPFPSRKDPLLIAREKLDKRYGTRLAVSTLAQALGRGVRAVDDECFTFVLDENLKWVVFSDTEQLNWMKEAYSMVSSYREFKRRWRMS